MAWQVKLLEIAHPSPGATWDHLLGVPWVPLASRLPQHPWETAGEGSSAGSSAICLGHPAGAPDSRLQAGPALGPVAVREVEQKETKARASL